MDDVLTHSISTDFEPWNVPNSLKKLNSGPCNIQKQTCKREYPVQQRIAHGEVFVSNKKIANESKYIYIYIHN